MVVVRKGKKLRESALFFVEKGVREEHLLGTGDYIYIHLYV